MPTFKDAKSGSAITVKVQPRAKKTGVAGVMKDGTLKIKVAAPPVDGAANEALIAFLAETLGIHKNQIDIVAGLSSERKLISLVGISPAEVEAKLAPHEADEEDDEVEKRVSKPRRAKKSAD